MVRLLHEGKGHHQPTSPVHQISLVTCIMESLRDTNLELQNTITHQPNNPYQSHQDQSKPNSYCYENLVLIDTSKLPHETIKQDEKVTIAKVPQLTFLYDLHYLKAYPFLTTIRFASNFDIKYPKIATSYDDQLVFPNVVTLVVGGYDNSDLASKLNIKALFPNMNHLVINLIYSGRIPKSITKATTSIINSIECERLSVVINNKNLDFKHNALLHDISKVLNQMQLDNPTHKQIKTVAVFGMFTLADIAQHPLLRHSIPHSNRHSSLPSCEEPNYEPTRAEHLILDDVHFDFAIDLQLFNAKLEANGNYSGVKSLQLYNCQLIQDTPIQLDNIIEAKEDWDTIEMTEMRDTYNEDVYGIYVRDDEDTTQEFMDEGVDEDDLF